ncbi:MAG: DUF664 domain-containing protein, partial [Actinophytocola sp.]|nr:DUF664 domain-containing protein [Actinophytocola sp.]
APDRRRARDARRLARRLPRHPAAQVRQGFGRTRAYTLRWVYLYLIKEYARHLGHPDLLRERIDGATGE